MRCFVIPEETKTKFDQSFSEYFRKQDVKHSCMIFLNPKILYWISKLKLHRLPFFNCFNRHVSSIDTVTEVESERRVERDEE